MQLCSVNVIILQRTQVFFLFDNLLRAINAPAARQWQHSCHGSCLWLPHISRRPRHRHCHDDAPMFFFLALNSAPI